MKFFSRIFGPSEATLRARQQMLDAEEEVQAKRLRALERDLEVYRKQKKPVEPRSTGWITFHVHCPCDVCNSLELRLYRLGSGTKMCNDCMVESMSRFTSPFEPIAPVTEDDLDYVRRSIQEGET